MFTNFVIVPIIIDYMQTHPSLVQRLAATVGQEINKYKGLGYGKYVAMLTFSLYFTLEYEALKVVWPYVHGIMPDIYLYVFSIVFVNVVVAVVYNVAMYFIYTRKIPFFEQYRVNKGALWPWESNPEQWRKTLAKTLKVVAINAFIVGPSLSLVSSFIDFRINMDMATIPQLKTILWQFMVFLLTQEVVFYLAHRVMHHPKMYWIHKQHHEYNITIALAAQYAHPLEQIFANSIPAGLGWTQLSKVYPVHIFTIIIWLSFRMFETFDGHCGYNWPWGQSQLFPFSAGGSYHYFHHKQNVGNYGAILSIMDTTFGTNEDYNKFQAERRRKSE